MVFGPNRSTINMVFAIHCLQELTRNKRIPLYACYAELLIKAYDSADRTLLWKVLARFGVPQENRVSVTRQFHDGMRAGVSTRTRYRGRSARDGEGATA